MNAFLSIIMPIVGFIIIFAGLALLIGFVILLWRFITTGSFRRRSSFIKDNKNDDKDDEKNDNNF